MGETELANGTPLSDYELEVRRIDRHNAAVDSETDEINDEADRKHKELEAHLGHNVAEDPHEIGSRDHLPSPRPTQDPTGPEQSVGE